MKPGDTFGGLNREERVGKREGLVEGLTSVKLEGFCIH